MRLLERIRLRGGVHPEDRKGLSSEVPIRRLPMPQRLYVSLQQHIGTAASPVVEVGKRVLKGQCIAVSQGAISAAVHAPTSGHIVAIGDYPAPHPSGLSVPTIVIEADGEDRWVETSPPSDPFALSAEDIARRVATCGIVGLGGATFPAAVKLEVGRKNQVRTLLINGSECEPYLTCDDSLMRERADEVVTGIRLIQHAVGAREVLVGIEANKPQAIAAMRAAAGGDVKVVAIPALYPMGWEKQLIRLLTGREVPAGGRAADVGVLVHNVATAYAVQQAIVWGRPLISRIVTVSGAAVRIPCNVEAPIGTPVQTLIDYCGGLTEPPARWVMGGPMMGQAIPGPHLPIVKGTSAVLALTAAEVGQPRSNPCIRCASCVRACPVGLLPLEMVLRIRAGELNAAVEIGLKDCIGCGSCSYVCPAHIPLVHYFNYAKGELAAKERARLKQEATKQLAEARAARLERLAREREEAARARAARKAAQEARQTTSPEGVAV